MSSVRIGIIGCGHIANRKHMPHLKEIPGVALMAFCDILPDRAADAAAAFGAHDARVYTDHRAMLASGTLDAVHVCTPNVSHAPLTIDALRAGLHVYCEKPMALTYADAAAMCAAAEAAGKLLSVGYQTRSDPYYQLARNLIRDGVLGEVYHVKARKLRRRGIPTYGVFLEASQGGGPMIDIGTHAIDAALFLIGNYDVASVTGAAYNKLGPYCAESNNGTRLYAPEEYEVEDAAMGFVRFRNGCSMLVEAAWAINMDGLSSDPVVVGDKAGLTMREGFVVLNGERNGALYTQSLRPNHYTRDLFKGVPYEEYAYDMRQWVSALTDGTPVLAPGREAAVTAQIIEGIYTSAQTGKTVYF